TALPGHLARPAPVLRVPVVGLRAVLPRRAGLPHPPPAPGPRRGGARGPRRRRRTRTCARRAGCCRRWHRGRHRQPRGHRSGTGEPAGGRGRAAPRTTAERPQNTSSSPARGAHPPPWTGRGGRGCSHRSAGAVTGAARPAPGSCPGRGPAASRIAAWPWTGPRTPCAPSRTRAAEAGAVRLAGDEPLAMLEDVLGSFPDVPVNIDVKTPTAIGPAVAAISRTRSAERVCIAGFDGDVVRKTLATLHAATGITAVRSPSRRVIGQFVAARAVEAPNAVISRLLAPYGALQVPLSHRGVQIVTEANVAAAHRAGCEVHVWTVDDPVTMRDLLVTGVDGIITNRVDLLSELLDGTRPATPGRTPHER